MTYYSPSASGSSFPRTPRTVVIPMAAGPHRYDEAIFHPLAPLTLAAGHPVLEWTLECLGLDGRIVFVVLREHYDRYNLEYLLGLMAPRLDIVVLDSVSEGSAASALAAMRHVDPRGEVFICHPDQYLRWKPEDFLRFVREQGADGAVASIFDPKPKWRFNYFSAYPDQKVREIAAKQRVGFWATAGIFYWREARIFEKYAQQLIAKDIRTNGNFFIAAVYEQALADHKKIVHYPVEDFVDLSTPEGVQGFQPASRAA